MKRLESKNNQLLEMVDSKSKGSVSANAELVRRESSLDRSDSVKSKAASLDR